MRSAQLGAELPRAGSDDPREKGEGAHEERSVGSWERAEGSEASHCKIVEERNWIVRKGPDLSGRYRGATAHMWCVLCNADSRT
jgi:hypothetical protein